MEREVMVVDFPFELFKPPTIFDVFSFVVIVHLGLAFVEIGIC